jgi:hypothetical protein
MASAASRLVVNAPIGSQFGPSATDHFRLRPKVVAYEDL